MYKIKRIKFYNHEIFGDKEYEFFKDENIFNNVILAGENGVGKTKLLEEMGDFIYNICNISNYTASIIKEMELELSDSNICKFDNESIKVNKIILYKSKSNGRILYYCRCFNDDEFIETVKSINSGERVYDFKLNGSYSPVDINYKLSNKVKTVTNKKLDENVITDHDLAHNIIQLLVDIGVADAMDLKIWTDEHDELPPDENRNIRMKRFTNAFKIMFEDNLIYKGLKDNTIPIFVKNGKEIEIEQLSSGEKQIIFRGVYLLQNKEVIKGYPIFIDEPEISMHPMWEKKIFAYYRALFCDENDNQTSQIFIATHSEHVLEDVLKRNDFIILKMKENEIETITKDNNGILKIFNSLAAIKHSIFDIYTSDYHILLYGYIQENLVCDANNNPIAEPNITETDEWLERQNAEIKPYSAIVRGGQKNYKTLPTYIRNCIDHPGTANTYNEDELKRSIDYMISLIN